MALPAVGAARRDDRILRQHDFADGRGLRVDYRLSAPDARRRRAFRRVPLSSRRAARRRSEDLIALTTDDGPLGDVQLYHADPLLAGDAGGARRRSAPLGDAPTVPSAAACPRLSRCSRRSTACRSPRSTRCSRPPIRWSTAWSGASTSPSANSRRRAATPRRSAPCSPRRKRRRRSSRRPGLRRPRRPRRFGASRRAAGSSSRCIARAANRRWSPSSACAVPAGIPSPDAGRSAELLGQPDPQRAVRRARAGDFIVTTAPNALLPALSRSSPACAAGRVMQWTGFGRRWRAYADDPLAAATVRRQPARDLRPDLRAGERLRRPLRLRHDDVSTARSATARRSTLGLKALIAAILGGVGSIPGAFVGGFARRRLRGAVVDLFRRSTIATSRCSACSRSSSRCGRAASSGRRALDTPCARPTSSRSELAHRDGSEESPPCPIFLA